MISSYVNTTVMSTDSGITRRDDIMGWGGMVGLWLGLLDQKAGLLDRGGGLWDSINPAKGTLGSVQN